MLSGSSAELRVADTENFVSNITTTLDEGQSSTAVSTDSVDSGFTLTIDSSWDKATVYANIDLELTNVVQIDDFTFSDGGADGTSTTIQLPQTSERQITTQVRVRPGDSILIAGLVRENDNFSSRGPGIMEPIFPDSRTATTDNLELVILLRPRVIVYTAPDDSKFLDYAAKKDKSAIGRMSPDPGDVTPPSASLYGLPENRVLTPGPDRKDTAAGVSGGVNVYPETDMSVSATAPVPAVAAMAPAHETPQVNSYTPYTSSRSGGYVSRSVDPRGVGSPTYGSAPGTSPFNVC